MTDLSRLEALAREATPEALMEDFNDWWIRFGQWRNPSSQTEAAFYGGIDLIRKPLAAALPSLVAEVKALQGAMDSQDGREREAGAKCGIPWEEHGCDWPGAVADRVIHLRAEVKALRAALECLQTDSAKKPCNGPRHE